jgi:hypothetical protein
MGMFDLPANPWQPQTNIATKLRELYVRLGLLGNNRQQDIQNAIQDPAGVAERLAGTVNEYIQDPMSYVGGGIGHIAYHGSPYKFDKFSLDKIGTGEGAQAYGHGLYLAEAPDVAKSYQALHGAAELRKGGNRVAMYGGENKGVLDELARHGGNFDSAIASQEKLAKDYNGMFAGNANKIKQTLEAWKANGYEAVPLGNMYKTDIPDEAVARFLDWDKPLSQQAPEVQAALGDLALKNQAHIGGTPIRQFIYDKTQQTGSLPSVVIGEIEKAGSLTAAIPALQRKFSGANDVAKGKLNELLNTLKQQEISMQTGVDYVRTGGDIVRGGYNPPEIAQMLQSKGIPGIRYLDGGSRSGGAGTSNFVAFDPEMIRILERNGIPTGNQPWKPGEFNIFKDTTESAPLFRDTTR